MVILVVFNSFNVVKNLKKPDLVALQKPPFYTTYSFIKNGALAVDCSEIRLLIYQFTICVFLRLWLII